MKVNKNKFLIILGLGVIAFFYLISEKTDLKVRGVRWYRNNDCIVATFYVENQANLFRRFKVNITAYYIGGRTGPPSEILGKTFFIDSSNGKEVKIYSKKFKCKFPVTKVQVNIIQLD